MKKLFAEFKEFAMRGNVMDLAVGIIIGAAFSGLVKSLVDHVLMPPLGWLMGGVDFSDKKLGLPGLWGKPGVEISYGLFLNALINFAIVAFAVFMLVKAINVARRKPDPTPDVPPAPTRDQELLMEIRDALRTRA